MITGATGTGKELVARYIHARSNRAGAFIAINCAGLSLSLAEAELFGHRARAFAGANEARVGWFETANGGTVFLDEVEQLPPTLQAKLPRVLQERQIVPVGSHSPIPLDVRLIAATNVDLARAVAVGEFRANLYYRLNVIAFDLPSLRERREDILLLADYFVRLYSRRLRIRPPRLAADAKQMLIEYSWPGNIRELENVIYFALLIAEEHVIRPAHLRFCSLAQPALQGRKDADDTLDRIAVQLDNLFGMPPAALSQTLESLIVQRAFVYCQNNQVQTAKLLGISRNILRSQLKRLGLIGVAAQGTFRPSFNGSISSKESS